MSKFLSRLVFAQIFAKKSVFLMFSIVCLLNINFAILRSLRSTLVVADLGGSASYIPYFELCGTLPGAILMTWGMARLLNRVSLRRAFFVTMGIFLGFFLLFAFGIYPFLSGWYAHAFSMLFFVAAELWKIALLSILFWGLVNQYIPVEEAKGLFAPLMLAGSAGTMLAGPLISVCSSEIAGRYFHFSQESWTQALTLMLLLLCFVGVLAAWCYHSLWKDFSQKLIKRETVEEAPRPRLSLMESLRTCLSSRYLMLLSWLVVADYIAYGLGEVIFLDVLKERFPEPRDYCQWMGNLSFWSGLATAAGALVVAPWILRRCRWVIAALALPLCLLITEGSFFVFLRLAGPSQEWFGWTRAIWLESVVILGSLQYCLCRAAKYTLFDSSKELAFVLLPDSQKMQGKLIIDGIGSRLGRGGASMLSLLLISLSGGVMASSWLAGVFAMGITASLTLSTVKLGKIIDGRKEPATTT